MGRKSKRGRWSAVQARKVLAAWRASGLGQEAFEKREGLSSRRLRWWTNRLTESEGPRLVPVVVKNEPSPPASCGQMLVHLPGGVTIEVTDAAMPSAQWVAAVARQLAEA